VAEVDEVQDPGYGEGEAARLEMIWGEGFLSPGGVVEVGRILGGRGIEGCDVLDVGSGAGGADVVLVQGHGAGTVTGIDVEALLVARAAERARRLELDGRIAYRLVEPGPIPLPDGSFDVVFSKDSIIHIRDKEQIFSEAFRVLRPGGLLLVSDWLRGDGDVLTPQVAAFITAAGHDFAMVSLRETREIVERVGFTDVEVEDRHAWYLEEATAELERLRGSLGVEFVRAWGEEATADEIGFWEVLVTSLRAGALRPGHVRATRPGGPALAATRTWQSGSS
jgi:SAM-dependent methyltransferase